MPSAVFIGGFKRCQVGVTAAPGPWKVPAGDTGVLVGVNASSANHRPAQPESPPRNGALHRLGRGRVTHKPASVLSGRKCSTCAPLQAIRSVSSPGGMNMTSGREPLPVRAILLAVYTVSNCW